MRLTSRAAPAFALLLTLALAALFISSIPASTHAAPASPGDKTTHLAGRLVTRRDDARGTQMLLITVRGSRTSQTVARRPLRDDAQGTLDTLKIMSEMARDGSGDERVNQIVKGVLLRGARAHDDEDEINHLFGFWRSQIAWRRDPAGVERIADFLATYDLPGKRWGDCGDKSIGLATSLAAIGHTPYYVALSQSPPTAQGWDFSHVYVGVRRSGQHYALDPTPEQAPPGWEAQGYLRIGYRIFPEQGQPAIWKIV